MRRAAVVLTHNRPEMLRQCVEAIGPQVDMVLVIDNASDPPVPLVQLDAADDDHLGLGVAGRGRIAVLRVPTQPPNLSAMWLQGLRILAQMDAERIAFLCDDAIAPAGWFDAVAAAMSETRAAIGCSGGLNGPGFTVKTAHDGDVGGRMPGWAFILDPASGVQPDPTFAWWFGDTDMDWQARLAGGMVRINGLPVPNLQPDYFIHQKVELAVQAAADRAAFLAKWGSVPWA